MSYALEGDGCPGFWIRGDLTLRADGHNRVTMHSRSGKTVALRILTVAVLVAVFAFPVRAQALCVAKNQCAPAVTSCQDPGCGNTASSTRPETGPCPECIEFPFSMSIHSGADALRSFYPTHASSWTLFGQDISLVHLSVCRTEPPNFPPDALGSLRILRTIVLRC